MENDKGSDGKRGVLVLDSKLKEIYTAYEFEWKGTHPVDVEFDDYGHLLVAYSNKELHIADADNGNHVTTVKSEKFGKNDLRCITTTKQGGEVVVGVVRLMSGSTMTLKYFVN